MPNTLKNNDLLNAAFNEERVLSADLPELKRYFMACAEMRDADILSPRVREGVPKRAEFIRFLIQSKEREISHAELATRGKWTLWVSLGTLVVVVIRAIYEICTSGGPPAQ